MTAPFPDPLAGVLNVLVSSGFEVSINISRPRSR
jgi:hypothetical protein